MAHFHGKKSNPEYPGVVSRVYSDGTVDIAYDDGDVDNAIPASVVRKVNEEEERTTGKAMELSKSSKDDLNEGENSDGGNKTSLRAGDAVMAHFRGKETNEEYPGVVSRVHNDGTIDVNYDDGDKDKNLPPSLVRSASSKSSSTSTVKLGDRVSSHFRGSLKNETLSWNYPQDIQQRQC